MPSPTRSDVHVNRPLTNISVAFLQNATNFVAARIFPNVPVMKKSDSYFTFPRGAFNRAERTKRAPSTESAGGGYELSTDTYNAEVYAFHKDIDDQIRDNADQPLNLDREATEFVTQIALIKREKLFVESYFTNSTPGDIWTFDADGVASSPTPAATFDPTSASLNDVLHWNDSSSNPLEDVALGKQYVLQSTGFEPNKLVVGYPVWSVLKNHPDIVDRIKYSGGVGPSRPAIVTVEAVAALFEVDEILVMKSIENTADEGQTATHSFIGGKHALLCYAAASPGIMTPSAGYTFSWTGHVGAGNMGNRISRFRMEQLKSDRVEIEMAFVQKRVSEDLGYFFGGIVA
jgi:hypothetical protein